jgi:hypothetical protein
MQRTKSNPHSDGEYVGWGLRIGELRIGEFTAWLHSAVYIHCVAAFGDADF